MNHRQSAPIKESETSACIHDASDEPPTLDRDQVCLCINIWAAFYPERLTLARQAGRHIKSVDERGARSWGG